jgi:hypothetical protein
MSRQGMLQAARGALALALLGAAAVGLFPGSALAQSPGDAQVLLTPAAPAPGQLAFDIPLYPWYLRESIDRKSAFVQVLAAETVALGEAGIEGDVQTIVQGALGLTGIGDRLGAAMVGIGETDPSFGIPDVSQLLPVEGAVRDTIFGFVVWHESSVSESRKTATDLERIVGRVRALGNTAVRLANDLAARSGASKEALGQEQYEPVVNAWADLDQSMSSLRDVADEAQSEASALGALAGQLRAQGPPALDAQWAGVIAATDDTQRLASGIGASLDALLASNAVFADITNALRSFAASVDALEAAQSDAAGMLYVPWTALKDDVDLVTWLDQRVLGDAEGVYPEPTKQRIGAALSLIVEADALLAERAVEYASTVVAGAADKLDDRYRKLEGYRKEDPQRKRDEAVQKAAGRMRDNMDLQSALISAREARAALAAGRLSQAAGSRSEYGALVHFKNAWLHALSGGASATRALAAGGVK